MPSTNHRAQLIAYIVGSFSAAIIILNIAQYLFFSFRTEGETLITALTPQTIVLSLVFIGLSLSLYQQKRAGYWLTLGISIGLLIYLLLFLQMSMPSYISTFRSTPFIFDRLTITYYYSLLNGLVYLIFLTTIIALLFPRNVRALFS